MRVLACLSLPILLTLGACDASQEGDAGVAQSVKPAAVTSVAMPEVADDTMARWSRTCALCHVRGEGGAPIAGDAAAWAPRLEQGEETLLKHTLEGLNSMPPLGYCMSCEEQDFLAMIRFMAGSEAP